MGRRKRKCEASGCGKTPCYGPEGGPLMFCAEHAGEGDVDTQGQPKPVGWVPPPPSIPRFREGGGGALVEAAPRSSVPEFLPPVFNNPPQAWAAALQEAALAGDEPPAGVAGGPPLRDAGALWGT